MKLGQWLLLGCAILPLCACASAERGASGTSEPQAAAAPRTTPAATPVPPSAETPPPAAATTSAPPQGAPAAAPSPEALVVYFDNGSARLGQSGEALADVAARLFRQGHPSIMYVVGYTDATGSELPNLVLSAHRAAAVKEALVARGIPSNQLEMQAKGQTEPAVAASPDKAAPHNRRVVITWH